MAQDRRHRGGARIDVGVDPERRHERHKRGVVDQRDRHGAAFGLGAHGGEHVGAVVIGDGEHGVGAVDARLGQKRAVQPVAMQHDGAFQRLGRMFGGGAVLFDDAGADAARLGFKFLRDGKAHIATADDDDAFLLLLGLAEDVERARHVVAMGEDIGVIPREDLIARFRGKERALASEAHHHRPQCREEVGQLPERRLDDRAVIVDLDAQKLGLSIHEHLGVEGGGGRQPQHGGSGHFAFGADDDVDGQVIAAVEIGIERVEISLAAQAGDLAVDGKDRMRHLAGDHVHLVGMGGGDDHVGVARPCPVKHVGMRGEARDALHVERLGRAADEIGIRIDHRDVVAFARKMPRDLPANLACPADNDLHGPVPFIRTLCMAEGPCPVKSIVPRARSGQTGGHEDT